MQVTDFISVYDNLATEDYCNRMIAKHKLLEVGTSTPWLTDRGQDRNGGVQNRKDLAFYFNNDDGALYDETNRILDEALSMYLDVHPGLEMLKFYSNAVKVQKTPPKGGFHHWHGERGSVCSRMRVLAWMIYLNDTPEGEGTTEFLEIGCKLQPKRGSVVLFPADWTHTHRGNPVYTVDKYIATGWYYLNGEE